MNEKVKYWEWLFLFIEIVTFALCYSLVYKLLLRMDIYHSMFREKARYAFEIKTDFIAFVIAGVVIFPILRRFFAKWRLKDFGVRIDNAKESLGLSFAILCIGLTVSSIGLLFIPDLSAQIINAYRIQNNTDIYIFIFFVSPIAAGIGEEIYFRSYLQGSLSKIDEYWGPVVAAIIFALLHSFQGLVPLICFHIPGALIIAMVYRKAGSLLATIPAHICIDMINFAGLYYCFKHPEYHFYIVIPLLCMALLGLFVTRIYIKQIIEELWLVCLGLRKNWKTFFIAVSFVSFFYGAKELDLYDKYAYSYSMINLGIMLGFSFVFLILRRYWKDSHSK